MGRCVIIIYLGNESRLFPSSSVIQWTSFIALALTELRLTDTPAREQYLVFIVHVKENKIREGKLHTGMISTVMRVILRSTSSRVAFAVAVIAFVAIAVAAAAFPQPGCACQDHLKSPLLDFLLVEG